MKYANIKFIIINLFLIIFIKMDSKGQVTQKNDGDSTEFWIKKINTEYININKDSSKFRLEQKSITGQSSEGGALEKFYDGKILRKVVLTLYGETGKLVCEYYFLNQQVILIYDKTVTYKSPIYMEKPVVKSREENKFYFKDQRLIRWIGNDSKVPDGVLYLEKEEQLLEDLEIIR